MSKVVYLLTAATAATVLVVCAVLWYTSRETLPPEIRIAAGKRDGLYHTFAQEFAKRLQNRTRRPVRVIETAGTEENVELLRTGGADLALIQTTSLTPAGVAGVAPLFPEPLHFIVRKSARGGANGIGSPADLGGRRVALGLSGSAIRQNSHTVLTHYGVAPENVRDAGEHFAALADPNVDAALVTTGWMNPVLEKLLRRDDVELVGLADPEALAARHPWFVATTIPRGLYPGRPPVPAEPVRTVAVTALMATRSDAPDELVRTTLGALYETDLRASFPAVMSAKAARDYDAAVMHPGAAAYHDPSARFARLTRTMELLSKSKEALFGAGAGAVLVWGWFRRRRERIAAAADQQQKQKLDEFIGRTLTVELEQMDVTDPEHLRSFLRRVTHIKQEALKELTSEKVRGDQRFAIFLSQCAALSEKIQMRMLYGRLSEEHVPAP
jgi:TRAP transporter TAXI family solute receptor